MSFNNLALYFIAFQTVHVEQMVMLQRVGWQCVCKSLYEGVLTDRCTLSQRWSMVAMTTVWVEGAVSILSMQKTGPLRSLSGFKMAVRLRSDWAFICCDDSMRRQTTERL